MLLGLPFDMNLWYYFSNNVPFREEYHGQAEST